MEIISNYLIFCDFCAYLLLIFRFSQYMIIRATKYHRMKLAGKGKPTDGVKLSGD